MAIHLPSNLYAGEAERFNIMPHVQFSTQLLAQRKAKDEAIDNYYKDLPNTINDKGVRDKDIPAIAGVKTQIQEYWSKNKDAIRKGNTPEALAIQKMYRDASYLVRESQNAAQVDLELGKRRFQGGSEHIFTNPDFMQQQQSHDLPVGDPNRTPIDLAHITLPPKPFEVGVALKKYSDIKPDEGMPQIQAHPTDKYYNIEVTPKTFGKEAKTAVYERAATDYENDPSFKNHIDNTLAKNPQQLKGLSELFTKEYGHPIDNEHDLAAAYMLSVIPKGEIKQKLIDSGLRQKEQQARQFAHQELMRKLAKADAKELINYRESVKASGDEELNNLWVDEYVNKVAEENKPTGKLFGIIPTQRKDFVADPVLYKALGDPSEISITRDGKFDIKYQKKNADGEMVEDKSRSKVMTPTEVKLALGYRAATKKQLTEEMNKQKNKPPAKPNKKVTDPELLKQLEQD